MDADMTIVQDQLSAMQVNGHSKGIDKKYILHGKRVLLFQSVLIKSRMSIEDSVHS